jgi:hypothetical protein
MINLTFLRVPEIHDGYEYKFFISQSMTVNEVVERVMEELGLARSLPITGGGILEYVVEEVWVDKNSESMLTHSRSFVQLTNLTSQSSPGCLYLLRSTILYDSRTLPTLLHHQQSAYLEYAYPTNGIAAQKLAICPQPPSKRLS